MKLIKLFPVVLSLFLYSSCYSFFQSPLNMSTGKKQGNLSEMIGFKEESTLLPAPDQLVVSQSDYQDRIIIRWNQVEGATSYRVERFVSEDGSEPNADSEFEIIKGSDNSPPSDSIFNSLVYSDYIFDGDTYDHSSAEFGYKYYYRVYAQSETSDYSENPYIQSSASDGNVGMLLSCPKDVKASAGEYDHSVRVRWTNTSDYDRIILSRGKNENGSDRFIIKTLAGNVEFFDDEIIESERGVQFYYFLESQKNGNPSVISSNAMGYALVEGAPKAVTGLRITPNQGFGDSASSIKIQWDKGADTTYYQLYRSSSADSKQVLLNAEITPDKTSYTDSQRLRSNILYYYYLVPYSYAKDEDGKDVVAEDGTKVLYLGQMTKSAPESSKPCEGFILSPPSTVEVFSNDNTYRIVFSLPVGSAGSSIKPVTEKTNYYTYKVFASNSKDGPFNEITYTDADERNETSKSILVEKNSNKYFRIQTCFTNDAGVNVVSSMSDVAAPAPDKARNVLATRAANIKTIYPAESFEPNNQEVYPTLITWDVPDGGAEGGYHVYRSTKPNSGFKRITTDSITETYYIDRNETAKPGVVFYYKVLSLNILGKGSNYSTEEALGYGAITSNQYMREYNKTCKASHKKLPVMSETDNMKRLIKQTGYGKLGGSVVYDASMAGLGARIIMKYTDYVEFWMNGDSSLGPYFKMNGNSNTSASMDASGTMDGTMVCTGMYNGKVGYDNIKIKGGAAGGGYYVITREGFPSENVDWTVGED